MRRRSFSPRLHPLTPLNTITIQRKAALSKSPPGERPNPGRFQKFSQQEVESDPEDEHRVQRTAGGSQRVVSILVSSKHVAQDPVERFDGLVGESLAPESDPVQAEARGPVTHREAVRHGVAGDDRVAADERVLPDSTELMDPGVGADRRVRTDLDVTGDHLFYGFVSAFSVGIIYSYRQQIEQWRYLLYGFGGLFLMGMALRSITIDPLG